MLQDFTTSSTLSPRKPWSKNKRSDYSSTYPTMPLGKICSTPFTCIKPSKLGKPTSTLGVCTLRRKYVKSLNCPLEHEDYLACNGSGLFGDDSDSLRILESKDKEDQTQKCWIGLSNWDAFCTPKTRISLESLTNVRLEAKRSQASFTVSKTLCLTDK